MLDWRSHTINWKWKFASTELVAAVLLCNTKAILVWGSWQMWCKLEQAEILHPNLRSFLRLTFFFTEISDLSIFETFLLIVLKKNCLSLWPEVITDANIFWDGLKKKKVISDRSNQILHSKRPVSPSLRYIQNIWIISYFSEKTIGIKESNLQRFGEQHIVWRVTYIEKTGFHRKTENGSDISTNV